MRARKTIVVVAIGVLGSVAVWSLASPLGDGRNSALLCGLIGVVIGAAVVLAIADDRML